jgi:hypothetical protein
MKLNRKFFVKALAFAVAGLIVSAAQAATKPASIAAFTPSVPKRILKVKKSSWRDPAFGNMGWTHSSDWGKFTVAKGKTVSIKLVSKVAGFHPAITVWHRGADDTASDTYVVDHFYQQNANLFQFGAKDEANGKELGNISMQIVAYGYDQDGNTLKPVNMNGLKDKVSGQMTLTFKTLMPGNYQFVVGGFNSSANVDGTMKHNVETTVTVK